MNHTIVSLVATRPARVQCNTCHGVHNYRKEKSAAAEAKLPSQRSSTRQTRKEPGNAARQEWAALQQAHHGERAVLYDMKASYKLGELVNHSKFGLGIVKRLDGPNKVEILFEEGLKLLRCG